jgi:hypothetical protein
MAFFSSKVRLGIIFVSGTWAQVRKEDLYHFEQVGQKATWCATHVADQKLHNLARITVYNLHHLQFCILDGLESKSFKCCNSVTRTMNCFQGSSAVASVSATYGVYC